MGSFIPFNIRFANNFYKNLKTTKKFNLLMNGAVGVRTQFLSWLSKNNKEENNSLKYEIKPKCFIFDNDKSGQEKFNSIKKLLEENKQKRIFNKIKIESNEISDKNNIFKGYKVIRTINDESEKAFILIYKNKKEIEDFIQDKELRKHLKDCKLNEKQKNLLLVEESNKKIIANSFKDYIDDLKDILGIKD